MTNKEAMTLKPGDLVVITRSEKYNGLVLEVVEPAKRVFSFYQVTLKQPVYSKGFGMENYDTRRMEIYRP